jgi:hypothetical protein
MDHRRVQRALFRMQLDPGFAKRLRARDTKAVASAGLGPEELELLAKADPAAVSADRGGKRRAQILRNVTSEFALSLALSTNAKLVEGFTAAREFHEAVTRDESLPLAFGDYLVGRRARGAAGAVAALERAMALVRRHPPGELEVTRGHVVLAPGNFLFRLPAGTLEVATRVRAALDRGEPAPAGLTVQSGPPYEHLLMRRTDSSPFRLPDVSVESLSPALGELLSRAERPRPRAELAADPERAEVVAELVAEGILLSG